MATQEETLAIFGEIEAFLASNIRDNKCVLIVGARNSGKTCLIKFFGGAAFTRDTNQQDMPFLVENVDVAPDPQPIYFKNNKIALQLTVLKINHPNTGQQVSIIEMPSFMSLSTQDATQKDTASIFNDVIFTIFSWRTVFNMAIAVHICLINPYEFITDDHKLIEFFTVWEKCITSDEQVREKIKQCVTIIFTKPQYEDDKEALVTNLEHLSQAGYEGIGENNTFFNATQESRVYCFLSQDTEAGQGQELLNSVLSTATYYSLINQKIFSDQWDQNFVWNFIQDLGDQKNKEIFKLVQKLFKKFVSSQGICGKVLNQSLALIGKASTLSFIKSLPKQSALKKKQKQIEAQYKGKIKQEPIIKIQNISKIIQANKKPDEFFEFLENISNLILKGIKAQILIEQLLSKIEELFWEQFKIDADHSKIISHWFNQKMDLWKFSSSFYKLCQKHKESHELQADAHMLQDLNKELTKKFASLLKAKISSGLKSYEVFVKLGELKGINNNPILKKLITIFGGDEKEGDNQQQEQVQMPSDPRIKRFYFKTQQNPDQYASIKERAKKIIAKPLPKGQQINQRQNIKNLLGLLQRQPQNRNQNLQLLAKKLIQFKLYQQALQIYMDLANSAILYTFLTQIYLCYLEQKQNQAQLEWMKTTLIPYLQQKSTIYSSPAQAQHFVYCVQACYDFLGINFADNGQEYSQLLMLSNEVITPNQEDSVDLTSITDLDMTTDSSYSVSQNKDMEFLRFASFSKAQIIAKIHERDQKSKKNNIIYTQIRKYLQATRTEIKPK